MDLEITELIPDGRGGASAPDGRLVRVRGAIPGDRISLDPIPPHGRTIDLHSPVFTHASVHRRMPPCPIDARCGGCDLSAFRAEPRVAALSEQLGRTYQLGAPVPVLASPNQVGHRARIKLAIDGQSLGYREARSHDLAEVAVCLAARPEINAAIPALAAWLREQPAANGLDTVELRSDGARVVYAFTTSARTPPGLRQSMSALGDVAVDGKVLCGDPRLTLTVAGFALRASPASFYQVNLEMNELLVAHVRQAVRDAKPERVLDLYAGIGNLSLPLAADGVPVLAVEAEGQATSDLAHNAHQAGLSSRLRGISQRVERFDASREPFDVVVIDPPRSGAPGVLAKLLIQRPRRVVVVSCHAEATARDLLPALKAGYKLVSAQGFDMFPDTHHVESVVVLDRG